MNPPSRLQALPRLAHAHSAGLVREAEMESRA
jgi:hypothetical protein